MNNYVEKLQNSLKSAVENGVISDVQSQFIARAFMDAYNSVSICRLLSSSVPGLDEILPLWK